MAKMRVLTHIFAILFAFFGVVGCIVDGDIISLGEESQGSLSLKFDLSNVSVSSKTQSNEDILQSAVLRITDSNGNLVRRYEPASAMPESIYMFGGDYAAQITIANNIYATFNATERAFSGSESFKIVAGEVAEVEIECKLQSATIVVLFDETIPAVFEDGYTMTISNGLAELIYSNPNNYTEDIKGYFTVPESATTFDYEFVGTKKVDGEELTIKGTMSAPAAREEHKITLKFSTYLDISSVKILVDQDSSDDVDDSLAFNPQPTISGVGFDMKSDLLQADGSEYQFSVSSIKVLSDIYIAFNDEKIELLRNGVVADTANNRAFEYVASSDKDGLLTINTAEFEKMAKGGANAMSFTMVDTSNVEGVGAAMFNIEGITTPTNIDFWSCTATLSAQVLDKNAQSVTIAYRPTGSDNWIKNSATKVDDTSYEIVAEPTWSAKTNENGNTVYTATGDIRSGIAYDIMLIVDGEEYPTANYTVEDRSQAIPYASMSDSSMSCFGSSNSSSAAWASGNNSFVSGLCSYDTLNGEGVAALTAKAAVGNFAAGNIIFGQFTFNGIIAQTGTVGFGQPFNWTTRPKSFKVRYAATIGVADYTDSAMLPSGSIDPARIYFAIVDWNDRHGVTSGSGTPSGVWDPAKDMELSEGRIIGYGSTFIEESTTTDTLHDLEMEIVYYDTETKPSNNITLVVSAVTSAYGDYMVGSTSNRLWVKDFAFGY